MVCQIDPDAPFRECKELHPFDAVITACALEFPHRNKKNHARFSYSFYFKDDEQRIHRGAFHYLRTGSIDKCVNFLHQSGHIAKAKAVLGCLMSEKEDTGTGNFDENDQNSVNHNDDGANARAKTAKMSSFAVSGNPLRLLWKKVAWSICEQELTSKWERAIIGACCGHRKSMLEASSTWEDKV